MVSIMLRSEMFNRCLHADYDPEGPSDYDIQLIGDTIYIFFEGSDEKEDWIDNFNFPATPYKDCHPKWRCHRGFLNAWKDMQDAIVFTVGRLLGLDAENEIKNITCIGYSHGGALSLLATEDMEYRYGKEYNVKGYGFEAPRVIWGIIPKEVKYRLRNYEVIRNKGDLVTHVPPICFGFRNAGTMYKMGKTFKYGPIKAHFSSNVMTELLEKEKEEA